MRYQDLRENWRFEDPKDLSEDPEHILHVSWSSFDSLSPFSPGKAQFISQIVIIAHKVWNCVYITSILSFHYFISFWAILTYHIWSIIRGLLEALEDGLCHIAIPSIQDCFWFMSIHPSMPKVCNISAVAAAILLLQGNMQLWYFLSLGSDTTCVSYSLQSPGQLFPVSFEVSPVSIDLSWYKCGEDNIGVMWDYPSIGSCTWRLIDATMWITTNKGGIELGGY